MSNHTVISNGDDYVSCLDCGAEYAVDSETGQTVAANGDEPTNCSGDTEMVHGDPHETGHRLDCEDGCEHCTRECNCLHCA